MKKTRSGPPISGFQDVAAVRISRFTALPLMKQHRWECAARARLGEDAGQRDVLWLAVQMQARARVTVRHQ